MMLSPVHPYIHFSTIVLIQHNHGLPLTCLSIAFNFLAVATGKLYYLLLILLSSMSSAMLFIDYDCSQAEPYVVMYVSTDSYVTTDMVKSYVYPSAC